MGTLQYSETGRLQMTYAVIYEKTGTGYSAYAPDLPGCITTGRTRAETERLMKEAIEFHLAGMREDGLLAPEPTPVEKTRETLRGRAPARPYQFAAKQRQTRRSMRKRRA